MKVATQIGVAVMIEKLFVVLVPVSGRDPLVGIDPVPAVAIE